MNRTPKALRPWLHAGLAIVAGLVISGCSGFFPADGIAVSQTGQNQPTQAIPAGTDPADEVVGRREHPRIIASFGGVYSDRKAEVMLARIAGRLLAAADQPNTTFTVTILDTPEVNAFALPGGFIYVTRGILALASSQSELAAVLAHEIAHVTLKHAQARSNRVRTSEIVDQVITGILGGNPDTDQTVAHSKLSLAAFSQNQELAADLEGIKIAGRAGYEPHAAARFLAAMGRFSQFSGNDKANSDDFLSSHPSTPDRIEKAIEAARAFGAPGLGEEGRDSYLKAIDGLRFGDNPDRGAIVGHQFIHPVLGFTFEVPKTYELQNTDTAVIGIAGDGEADRFDSAEVPETLALTDYLRSGWIAGLKPDTVHDENFNGVNMASGEAETDQWMFRVTALRFKAKVYRFIFATRADSDAFQSAVDRTLKSFREATPGDLGKIQTRVIELVQAKAGDTTATLVRKMANLPNARDLFLVLNNLYDGDPITPGQSYKIVTIK